MTFILFILIVCFIIVPLFKSAVAIYRARRTMRRFFDQFRQDAAPGSSQSYSAPPQQPKHKKKINPEDGEFVAFEDLPSNDSDQTAERTAPRVTVEKQIVDVEWEDIQ